MSGMKRRGDFASGATIQRLPWKAVWLFFGSKTRRLAFSAGHVVLYKENEPTAGAYWRRRDSNLTPPSSSSATAQTMGNTKGATGGRQNIRSVCTHLKGELRRNKVSIDVGCPLDKRETETKSDCRRITRPRLTSSSRSVCFIDPGGGQQRR